MRGLLPLVGLAAAVAVMLPPSLSRADEAPHADEPPPGMVEVPTPYPPRDCCVVVEAKGHSLPTTLLVQGHLGVTYRRAFREDFAAAHAELEVGGQDANIGIGARLTLELGATRVGLPYQVVGLGPAFNVHLAPRLQLAVGFTFGALIYQRATSSSDPNVWGVSAGVNGTVSYDIVRNRRDGALYVLARLGYDYVHSRGGFDTGSTLGVTAALGYRY
jgi:hypothetical protein